MQKKQHWERIIATCVLLFPACVYLWLLYLQNFSDSAGWKMLLVHCGFIALGLLVLLLCLNPLRKIVGPNSLLVRLNRHRRKIGVAVFGYACLHFLGVVMRTIFKKGSFDWLYLVLHPVLATGFLAFLIFFVLALTSNDYSVKKLGAKRWKQLHHWVYAAEALIFAHLLLQGGNKALIAFALFIPLIFIQRKSRNRIP